jgi:predicted metalloprotease with PDZ domain
MKRLVLISSFVVFGIASMGAQQPRPAAPAAAPAAARAAAPVTYRVTFPEPEHHWMQVEVTFSGLGTRPLQARMSRSSPGRYAVHEFAKNIFSVEAFNSKGTRLTTTRPTPYQWNVAGHDGSVRLVYKIFGDRGDGTYFAVDNTHARLNIPASFMWAVGLESRTVRVTFVPPAGSNWKVGTQLFPTSDPFTYTAPNLQYFMDSPTEVSNFGLRTFTVKNPDGKTYDIRVAAHHDGSDANLDALAKDVERVVLEQGAVFGEFPAFDTGNYVFLLDYTPHSDGDGMEHRNSTFTSSRLTISNDQQRLQALGTISHEFFHAWNVERIRPADLEPFNFTDANVSCCLWLAEGFTQYYGNLLLIRAGFTPQSQGGIGFGGSINAVVNGSGRLVRSAVEMSQHAPYTDAAASIDKTEFGRSFISYYTYGAAIALALDLSLREMSDGAITLDDYMHLLWTTYGKPAAASPGFVARPYTLRDLRNRLADLTKNKVFADEFFDKYVEGREVVNYERLMLQAGFVVRPRAPEAGWIGNVQVAPIEGGGGLVINPPQGNTINPIAFGTPAYEAGLEYGDIITTIDGQPATVETFGAMSRKKPGDSATLVLRRRGGQTATTTVTLKPNPALTVIDVEAAGATMTAGQKAFRQAWLGSKVK